MYLCSKLLNFGVFFATHKFTNFRELLFEKFKQFHNEDSISSNNYGGFDVKDSSNKGARFNNEDIFIGFLEPNRTVL